MNPPEEERPLSGRASAAEAGGVSPATSPPHEEPQEPRRSPHCAEAVDVVCDLCEGRKSRACKSCLTCLASFCKTHVRDHYTVEALQRHLLVEVTKNLHILQENAQLKKMIMEGLKEKMDLKDEILSLRQENLALKAEISALRQTISELPDDFCNSFVVSVRPTGAAERCGLRGHYLLQTDFDSFLLKELNTGAVLYTWPYQYIRRYGRDKTTFSLEAGRRCDSGAGEFVFGTKEGNAIYQYVDSIINLRTHKQGPGGTLVREPAAQTCKSTPPTGGGHGYSLLTAERMNAAPLGNPKGQTANGGGHGSAPPSVPTIEEPGLDKKKTSQPGEPRPK